MLIQPRTCIRLFSFLMAAFLGITGLLVQSRTALNAYRSQVEFSYMRSLQEISSHLNAITIDLKKAGYAGTPAQISSLSAKVWRDAGSAKSAMSSLPLGEAGLDATWKFLSQAGDYAMYLSKKTARGQELTEEERRNFQKLTAYAISLNEQISRIEKALSSGQVDIGDYLKAQQPDFASDELPVIGFKEVEEGLDGYPTLIYDGPFSDNLLNKEPELTKQLPQITRERALEIAEDACSLPFGALSPGPDEESRMPSYTFTGGTIGVGATKNGGLITWMIDSRPIGAYTQSISAARRKAKEHLSRLGMDSMTETYYEIANGICTVNFAYFQNSVTCYTDLIKVGVAMDDGGVVFYDARGFISNHRERDLPKPKLTAGEAQKSVSSLLRVRQSKPALIPSGGQNEVLTWEFLCHSEDGGDVLVYINAETGAEEQILILIENENGVLTM